jgi:hypothetical protein
LVEQRIRNAKVGSSTLLTGTTPLRFLALNSSCTSRTWIMTTSARATRKKAPPGAKKVRSRSAASKRAQQSATNVAITTELAPAVAIALLDKTEQVPGAAAPALDCLAAGAVASDTDGKVRVQLMFQNGAVLPVEMSNAAGAALSKGLTEELPKK